MNHQNEPKKKLKTFYIIIALVFLTIGFAIYSLYKPTNNLNPIYLIPKDAVYILQTDDPVGSWRKLSKSQLWQYLRSNQYFAQLTASASTLDTIINDNSTLLNLLGKKQLWVSAHTLPNGNFDHLMVLDLGKTAKLTDFKTILKSVINQQYNLTDRKYRDTQILELFDKKTRETIYLAIINNNLIASYTSKLVEDAIAQKDEPIIGRDLNYQQINQNISTDGEARLFLHWAYLNSFAKIFDLNDNLSINTLSKTLYYSGIDLNLKNGKNLIASGYTNINQNSLSYLLALQKAGTSKPSIDQIAPIRTGAYISFGFSNYQKFYKNYLDVQKQTPEAFKNLTKNQKQIENLLNIDLEKHFISWIDDEIALLKFETETFGSKNDFALVIKSKNPNKARKNLDHILKQIKKRSPVKFKTVNYKNHDINFMSVKGFFRLFFGGFFNKLDTPYYSIIDNYVVFTNHPNTLKYIINNYLDQTTLILSEQYTQFKKLFKNKSNLYAYINTPMFYKSLVDNFTGQTKKDLLKNQDYFSGFTQIGFQLYPEDDIFKSKTAIEHQPWKTVKHNDNYTEWNYIKEETLDFQEVSAINLDEQTSIDIPDINPDNLNAKTYTKYYDNGKKQYDVELKNGQKHGRFKSYYNTTESLKLKGRFKNDKPTGKWKLYDINGEILKVKKY